MTQQRNPNNSERCFFHIDPSSVLTANESIAQCVRCITHGNPRLQSLKEDFHQTAYEAALKAVRVSPPLFAAEFVAPSGMQDGKPSRRQFRFQ